MKFALFILLAVTGLSSPTWIPANTPMQPGLIRVGPLPMTGSMRPALHGGEMLRVEPYTPATKLEVWDIVAVNTRSGPRTHRITAINKRAIMTSGDAVRNSDGWSLKAKILYVVRFVERKG